MTLPSLCGCFLFLSCVFITDVRLTNLNLLCSMTIRGTWFTVQNQNARREDCFRSNNMLITNTTPHLKRTAILPVIVMAVEYLLLAKGTVLKRKTRVITGRGQREMMNRRIKTRTAPDTSLLQRVMAPLLPPRVGVAGALEVPLGRERSKDAAKKLSSLSLLTQPLSAEWHERFEASLRQKARLEETQQVQVQEHYRPWGPQNSQASWSQPAWQESALQEPEPVELRWDYAYAGNGNFSQPTWHGSEADYSTSYSGELRFEHYVYPGQ
ncbi:hypothetical protein CPC08DRAFT_723710 [Agrocybe pediades]|nr:hypothetical protein CPC08DRAFT_723710 [Agrocybe pediades]